MSALGRRQRQWAHGHRHLAKICGKAVKGGRPIYRRRRLISVAEAIANERAKAAAEAARRARKAKRK